MDAVLARQGQFQRWVYGGRAGPKQSVGLGALEVSSGVLCVDVGAERGTIWEGGQGVQFPLVELGGCLVRGASSLSARRCRTEMVKGMIGALGGGEDLGARHTHVVANGKDSGLVVKVVDRSGAGATCGYSKCRVLRDLEAIYVGICSAGLPGGVSIGQNGADKLLINLGYVLLRVTKGRVSEGS